MKSSWLIILVVVAVAAYLLLMRGGSDDLAEDSLAARLEERRAASECIDDLGRDAPRAGGVAGRAPGGLSQRGVGRGGDAGDPSRRGGAGGGAQVAGGGATGSRTGGGIGTRPGERRGGIGGRRVSDLPSRSLDVTRSHDDLPLDGGPDEEAVVADDELDAEEVPEVVFDGGGRSFDTAAQVQIAEAGPIAGEAGSIAFWVEPGWEPQSQEDATFLEMGDSALQIEKDGDSLRFEFVDGSGNKYGGTYDISGWQAGDHRHVVGTWTGSMLALYVDGAQVFYNGTPTYPALHSETPIYVGSSLAGGVAAAPATMSGLNVLNRSLSDVEIRQLYESGRTAPD